MFLCRSSRASPHLLGIYLICVLVSVSVSYRLSDPRIRLAYTRDLPTNYTIEVVGAEDEDCFDWRSGDEVFTVVTPIYDGECSQKAIITAAIESGQRRVTYVAAYHNTKWDALPLVCEVITDHIASFELHSLKDEIAVPEPPLLLKVIGKTKGGEVFTSINGLQFEWTRTAVESVEDGEILDLAGSTDQYDSCDDVQAWKDRDKLGYCLLAIARNAGVQRVQAKAFYRKDVEIFTIEAEKLIKVLPGVKLMERTVYMLPHTYVDIDIIDIDDKRKSTALRISGGSLDALVQTETYNLVVEIYDSKNNTIYPSQNIDMVISSSDHVEVVCPPGNGMVCRVRAIRPGNGTILAELLGVKNGEQRFLEGLRFSSTEKIKVLEKIEMMPSVAVLPYEESTMPQKFKIRISGCESCSFAVNDSSVASIHYPSLESFPYWVEVHVKKVTTLLVTVFDDKYPRSTDTMLIYVKPVIDIHIDPTVLEAEINSSILVPVLLWGDFRTNFSADAPVYKRQLDHCSQLKSRLRVEIIDPFVLTYVNDSGHPPIGNGCLTLEFRCNFPGHTAVNFMYDHQLNATHNSTYKSTAVLGCFKQAKPVHPVKVAVLALGTSKEVAFEGGPRPWILDMIKTGHIAKLEPEKPDLFDIELIKDPFRFNKDLTVFRVTCRELGESEMNFTITNHEQPSLRYPASSEASIRMICATPASLHLKLKQTKKNRHTDKNIVKVPFYGSKTFTVEVWAKDSNGRKFANISSFDIDWKVSDQTLAKPISSNGFETDEYAVSGYRKIIRDFKEFKMTGEAGSLRVKAVVTKYKSDVMSKAEVFFYEDLQSLSSHIDLKLVSLRDIHANEYAKLEAPHGVEKIDESAKEEGRCDCG